MTRRITIATALALGLACWAPAGAQSPPPAGGGHPGSGMAQHGPMPGPMMGGDGPMGSGMMHGGMMGMPGGMSRRDHLEHLMVTNPKAAAQIMRFRGDMLRAVSEVLLRHAAELDKGQ